MTKITEALANEIVRRYEAGESTVQLAVAYKVSHTCIGNWLRKKGANIRPASKAARPYTINDSFFADKHSEQACYWAGFIAADGNISGNRLSISLSAKDRDHLIRLKRQLQAENPITIIRNGVRLAVSSEQIASDLAAFGITEKKTFSLSFPEWLNEEQARHFIRGYFDGDGSVSLTIQKISPYPQVDIIGTVPFIESVRHRLCSATNISQTKLRLLKSGMCYTHWSGSGNAIKIREYLYRNATVWLPRKRKLFDSIVWIGSENARTHHS